MSSGLLRSATPRGARHEGILDRHVIFAVAPPARRQRQIPEHKAAWPIEAIFQLFIGLCRNKDKSK
jgi:hypothetical protein